MKKTKLTIILIFSFNLIILNILSQDTLNDKNIAASKIQKAWLNYKNYLDYFFFKENSSPYSIVKILPIYKTFRISSKLKDQFNFEGKDKNSFNLNLISESTAVKSLITSYIKNYKNQKIDLDLNDYFEALSFAQAWEFNSLQDYLLKNIIKTYIKNNTRSSNIIIDKLKSLNIDINKVKRLLENSPRYKPFFIEYLPNNLEAYNALLDTWWAENYIEIDNFTVINRLNNIEFFDLVLKIEQKVYSEIS